MNYNLLEEKWIPVLWKDGHTSRVGVLEALELPGEIHCIALASPLDLFAVHRFILTLLYWKAALANGVDHVRDSLLTHSRVPVAVSAGIKKEAASFNLFDDKSPFMQDPSLRSIGGAEKKSAGSFFAECATGTNIAHFHHGDDENMRLCLPCATLGMLRVVPWTQSGGAGLTPSVHNAPPIMAMAAGANLALTLGLNLVPLDIEAGQARWSGFFKPADSTKPINYLEAFTWNPRRILLSSPETGVCWYCGESGLPTIGKIAYVKNDNTKLLKKGGKSIPFSWHDPAGFYHDSDYAAIRSYSEIGAMDNKDLALLLGKDMGAKKRERPRAIVVEKNVGWQGWHLVIPCTNPKNNKSFDHRLLDLNDLSPEALRSALPTANPQAIRGLDGWKQPKRSRLHGSEQFVLSAANVLTQADWGILSNAAFRDMHYSPAAFDVFSGLYWGLPDKKINRLPSRNVAWLTLKLMAFVPARVRVIDSHATFRPLQLLPKRQINEGGRTSLYPVSFPSGPRLEAALRAALDGNMRRRHAEPVDWIGLCSGLDQLLD